MQDPLHFRQLRLLLKLLMPLAKTIGPWPFVSQFDCPRVPFVRVIGSIRICEPSSENDIRDRQVGHRASSFLLS